VLLRQDGLGAKHHLHVVELLGEPQQQLDTAREGDRLEGGETGEQILPARLLTARELGTKDGQRLSRRFQTRLGKKIVPV
jgi:hypothetical protein